jgi:hypothetical protein
VWPFLVVIDLDEVTVRCRLCRWTSPTQATVEQARVAYAAHPCTDRPAGGPFLGWCAICGRVRVRGLRPVGPPRPRAQVHTWVCAGGCRRSTASSPTAINLPLLLLMVAAAVATAMTQPVPPPVDARLCVVGDPAGAWDARPCPHAPARHPEPSGGPA